MDTGHSPQLLSLIFLALFALFSCASDESNSKENGQAIVPTEAVQELTINAARENLGLYYDFIEHLSSRGFVFWDFRTFLSTEKSLRPENLIVIRHDIHHRDIGPGYYAYKIEEHLLGKNVATNFVMFFYSDEFRNNELQTDYLNFIAFLEQRDVEIQAHFSPLDMFIAGNHFDWMDLSEVELEQEFKANYSLQRDFDGTTFVVTGEDFLDIDYINSEMERLITKYKIRWNQYTGNTVTAFASHGSSILLNKVIKNSNILDQKILLDLDLYEYDTYNSSIFSELRYLSDNSRPGWLYNPSKIKPGQYQLLMHPKVWTERPEDQRFPVDNEQAKYCLENVDDFALGLKQGW